MKQRTELYKSGDPKFLVIGNYLIPVVTDETLRDGQFQLIPPLTQEDIDEWIKKYPEKAQKFLTDAKEAMEYSVDQPFSVSYTVKNEPPKDKPPTSFKSDIR